LNALFRAGEPSNNLAKAGVLVRQFDGQSDLSSGRPWLPCPSEAWCHEHEQFWPSSIINSGVRHLYYPDKAGFVLAPELVTVMCACQADCNSNSQAKGRRGCSARPCCDYDDVKCAPKNIYHEDFFHFVDHDCSYPPDELYEALAAQQRREDHKHNEIVLDNLKTAEQMPDAVMAFFFMSEESRTEATTMHRNFLQMYGVSATQCPLLRLDLSGTDPFGT